MKNDLGVFDAVSAEGSGSEPGTSVISSDVQQLQPVERKISLRN